MLLADFLGMLERLVPIALARPWDNCGLLVGDSAAPVVRVLAALELTGPVLDEAVSGGFGTVLTHHPLLFTPLRSLVESQPREALVRGLVRHGINLIACHTNLDAAGGGIADIAARALGLHGLAPLEPASAGWVKFVGFVPAGSLEEVAAAVFAAGAGGIGRYSECGFASEGTGWFTPGLDSRPAVGSTGRAERAPEVRWETVAPKERTAAVVRAFVAAHPYEEPAFDLYPVEDVLPSVGLGRVGELREESTLESLARRVTDVFELSGVSWCGDAGATVRRVGVLPGSGRGSVRAAKGLCDAIVSGDLGYHDSETAAAQGMGVIDAPHGELEWWAFKRWCASVTSELSGKGVALRVSERWRSPWNLMGASSAQ